MAILTKYEIIEQIEKEKISFSPNIDAFQLQPHAVDLRLGTVFYIPKSWEVTKNGREALNIDYLNIIENKDSFDIIQLTPGQYFEMLPNEFIIASTLEKIAVKNHGLMAVLYPRSSFNRRGLAINLSGIIDSGYEGNLMIPIQNNTTNQIIKVYPGERVCQIVFKELSRELSEHDVKTHGNGNAKYSQSDEKSLLAKKDKEDELNLIRQGNLQKIKDLYPIKYYVLH